MMARKQRCEKQEEAKVEYSPKNAFPVTHFLQLGSVSYLYYLTIALMYYCNPIKGLSIY